MEINLCSTSDELNVINKKITIISSVTATVKTPLSVENPILYLHYDGEVQSKINYVDIPSFNRKYYITDIIDLTGGRYEVHCSVDVLESFKKDILKLNAIIDKQKGVELSNMYYDDNSFRMLNKEFNAVINFPRGFIDEGEYILITAGGGGGIV